MGIKNLTSIIKRYTNNSIKKVHLTEYRGKIIAIDLSIYLYKYMYNGNYLDGFVKQILRLFRNNIIPLYIFDGKPPEEKKEILNDRKLKRDNMTSKQQDIETILKSIEEKEIKQTTSLTTDIEEEPISKYDKDDLENELKKLKKKIIKITSDNIKKCKELFDLFGVPYITSNCEAETLCSELCKQGIAHGCLSEDTDILANGGNIFLRDFTSSTNYVMEYNLDLILNELKLTYVQFVDMCILCGCDYTSKIYGIGAINAYKYITKYNNIETVIENINDGVLKKHTVPNDFNYIKARELFNESNNTSYCISDIKLKNINTNDLLKFINENCNLGNLYIKIIKNLD
jgi:flap endonuclease-1